MELRASNRQTLIVYRAIECEPVISFTVAEEMLKNARSFATQNLDGFVEQAVFAFG